MISATDHWITTDRGNLFARKWTPTVRHPDRSATIVLIHDSLGSVELWRDFPPALAAATGRCVIAYDRLGFGRSDALKELLPPHLHPGRGSDSDPVDLRSFRAEPHHPLWTQRGRRDSRNNSGALAREMRGSDLRVGAELCGEHDQRGTPRSKRAIQAARPTGAVGTLPRREGALGARLMVQELACSLSCRVESRRVSARACGALSSSSRAIRMNSAHWNTQDGSPGLPRD